MGFIEFLLSILWLDYCALHLCLFDAIVELYAMDERMFNNFLIGTSKWISYVIKVYLIPDVYVVKAFITLN